MANIHFYLALWAMMLVYLLMATIAASLAQDQVLVQNLVSKMEKINSNNCLHLAGNLNEALDDLKVSLAYVNTEVIK